MPVTCTDFGMEQPILLLKFWRTQNEKKKKYILRKVTVEIHVVTPVTKDTSLLYDEADKKQKRRSKMALV